MTSMSASSRIALRFEVPRTNPDWTLPEEPVPESLLHHHILVLLEQLLIAWIARRRLPAQIARNLAVRWDQARPKTGVDPDLCVITPPTPEGDALTSLRTWEVGHSPPKLAIEVVSEDHPYKDYVIAPAKYAALGVEELWIYDPKLVRTKHIDGPHRLQIWRRVGNDFERTYAGEGPAYSTAVEGWLFAVHEGERLRIADDREGTRWWETPEERERSARDAATAARDAAEVRVAMLEAEVRRLRGE
jgi:Uma2 family endonuclease